MAIYPGHDPTSAGQVIDPIDRFKFDIGGAVSRALREVRDSANRERYKHEELRGLARRVELGGRDVAVLGRTQARRANQTKRDVDSGDPRAERIVAAGAERAGGAVSHSLHNVGTRAGDPDVRVTAPDFDSIRHAASSGKGKIERETRARPPLPKER